MDITGSETDKIDFGTPVMEAVKDLRKNGGLSENSWITSGIRQQEYESYYADNGSLLFIGIFLGSLFLMGTAMIIYYKHPEKVCLYDREINFGNCYRKTKEIHGCFTNMSDSVL